MYTSSAYGRPFAGVQQGAAQYPGMQPQQLQQPQQATYAPLYGGPSQAVSGSTFAPKQVAGGLQDALAPRLNVTSPAQAPLACSQAIRPQPQPQISSREQTLELKVRQLEQTLADKDAQIENLRAALASVQTNLPKSPKQSARGSLGRSGSGLRRSQDSAPVMKYQAVDQDDPIDIRLQEFYNTTDSTIQFKRINKGFYRFGDSIVEMNIINHKLMAKTEDGWNRGKFGPVERFLMYHANTEREE